MKNFWCALFFALVALSATAQRQQRQKNDSICQLIVNYLNKQAYDSMYELTAPIFRARVSKNLFEDVALAEYKPLGGMKTVIFKKFAGGDMWYDVQFDSASLAMIFHPDTSGKLEFFRLKKGKQNNLLSSNNSLQTTLDKKVDVIAQRIMMQEQSVGLSIGILKAGKTYFYGYGETAKPNGTIPDSATVFELASITKVFTATLIAKAVTEKMLQLNSPINHFLPDSIPVLQFDKKRVTIKNLANHTAAIPFMPFNFDSTIVKHPADKTFYSIKQLNSFLKHLQISRTPGAMYQYSNAGFGILANALINLYHTSYDQLLNNKLLKPLHMRDTKTFIAQANDQGLARGYNENGELVQSWDHRPVLIGHGGLASSARDMLKFAAAQIKTNKKGLAKAIDLTHHITYSDKKVTMGLGWVYIKPGNDWILHHTGSTEGYNCYFAVDTINKLAVILLSNAPISLVQDGDLLMKELSIKENVAISVK